MPRCCKDLPLLRPPDRAIYQALLPAVDFKAPGELWNYLSKTALSKCIIFGIKGLQTCAMTLKLQSIFQFAPEIIFPNCCHSINLCGRWSRALIYCHNTTLKWNFLPGFLTHMFTFTELVTYVVETRRIIHFFDASLIMQLNTYDGNWHYLQYSSLTLIPSHLHTLYTILC